MIQVLHLPRIALLALWTSGVFAQTQPAPSPLSNSSSITIGLAFGLVSVILAFAAVRAQGNHTAARLKEDRNEREKADARINAHLEKTDTKIDALVGAIHTLEIAAAKTTATSGGVEVAIRELATSMFNELGRVVGEFDGLKARVARLEKTDI